MRGVLCQTSCTNTSKLGQSKKGVLLWQDFIIVSEITVVITFCETRSQKLRSNDLALNIRYKPSYSDKGIHACTYIVENIQERNI